MLSRAYKKRQKGKTMSKETINQKTGEIQKEVKLIEHGNYIFATLDGVDCVGSGVMTTNSGQRNTYSASVKLKFIIKEQFLKDINGIKIPTLKANSVIIRIPCEDSQLVTLVKKYNDKLNQDLLIKYSLTDGQTVNVVDESEILSIN